MATVPARAASADPTLRTETAHFQLYGTDHDAAVLDDIEKSLEGCYARITSKLKSVPGTKTQVYIYPTIRSFNEANRQMDPSWPIDLDHYHASGTAQTELGRILLVSPLVDVDDAQYACAVATTPVHEFIHIVSGLASCRSFTEGVADYLSDPHKHDGRLQADCATGTVPHLADILASNPPLGDTDVIFPYAYGSAFLGFVEKEFGFDCVLSMVHGMSPSAATGMSMAELDKKWTAYMNDRFEPIATSAHFAFCADTEDLSASPQLQNALEGAYSEAAKTLGAAPQGKLAVRMFKDAKSLRAYNAWWPPEDASICRTFEGTICLVDPDSPELSKAADDVVAQAGWAVPDIFASRISRRAPIYLSIGVASYLRDPELSSALIAAITDGSRPALSDLQKLVGRSEEEYDVWVYGALFAGFVAREYGTIELPPPNVDA